MKAKARHIILHSIGIFLLLFWIYIALGHIWHMQDFYASLEKQPFPLAWARPLSWIIPGIEVLIFLFIFLSLYPVGRQLLHAYTGFQVQAVGYILSAALLCIFSIYIGLGLLGMYGDLPCGCASVFGDISWTAHLLINIVLIGLSIACWYLIRRTHGPRPFTRYKRAVQLFSAFVVLFGHTRHKIHLVLRRRFPRKFALFPGRPVLW